MVENSQLVPRAIHNTNRNLSHAREHRKKFNPLYALSGQVYPERSTSKLSIVEELLPAAMTKKIAHETGSYACILVRGD